MGGSLRLCFPSQRVGALMSLIALGCLKQVVFFQLFSTVFIEKKFRVSYSLIILSPPPTSPRSSPPTHLIPFLSLKNKTQETHTQMPTKTQVKTSKQINRQ